MAAITFLPPSNTTTMSISATKWRTSEEDWEHHRARIRQLYLDEDRPLKEVMAIMQREHGFNATVKMYKTHITKWELDKRNKEHEVMAIVRKKCQRDAVGKSSEFHIRGRLVSIEDVHRYLKRKGMSVEDAIARRAATPPNLRCCTPEAVPSSPTNPEIFEAHRRILVSVRSYVLGSIELNTWSPSRDWEFHVNVKHTNTSFTDICINSFHNAYGLLKMGSFQKAGKFLIKGSAVIQDVIWEDYLRMLPRLFDVVALLRRGGWIDCSNIILHQFSEMAAAVLTEMHPLRTIFRCLISFDPGLTEDIIINAWESFTDVFEQASGSSVSSIRNRAEYIHGIVRDQDPDLAEAQLRSIVEKYKEVHGNPDIRYMEALMGLSKFLRVQRRTRDTVAVAEELIRHASECKSRYATEMWCHGMETLAHCHYCNYDTELAESTLRQEIDVCGKIWGWQNAYTLGLLTLLEQWLTVFGKDDEVAEVSEQIAEILRQSNDFV